jgi:hypothetical protein
MLWHGTCVYIGSGDIEHRKCLFRTREGSRPTWSRSLLYSCEKWIQKQMRRKRMEALNLELIVILLTVLGFGSSIIHYVAFAKSKVKIAVTSNVETDE